MVAIYLNSTSSSQPAQGECSTNKKAITLLIVGIVVALAGFFLLLSALNVFGHGINSIGLAGQLAGGLLLGAGCIAVLFAVIQMCKKKESLDASGQRSEVANNIPGSEHVKSLQADIDLQDCLTLSAEKKQEIAEEKITQGDLKTEYEALLKNRNLPRLCGYVQYAKEQFNVMIPGIAAVATLLSRKHNIKNIHVCNDLVALQQKLLEIQNSPENQRHAFIVPTHSSAHSHGHKKSDNWEQHKLTIGVEKIDGHTHIYLLESMLAYGNTITQSQINLNESMRFFTELELVLAFIDAAGLKKATTSCYVTTTRREFAAGCSSFALKDACYFLRDPHFSKKIVVGKSDITLPKTDIVLQNLVALPPEYMQLAQSMSTIETYKRSFPDLAKQSFGSNVNKKLDTNVEKHKFYNKSAIRTENYCIGRNVLKLLCIILELLRQADDDEIQTLVGQTLLVSQKNNS
jgi:hypothetical protein